MRKNNSVRTSWLTPEKKRAAVEAIIAYYQRERGEQIGVIASEEILELVLELVGKDIYNNGVDETVKLFEERLLGVRVDVEAVVKR